MGRKSPRGGFSISTDATLPQLPQRHSRVTSSPHQLTVGAPLYRGLNLYGMVGGSRVEEPRQSCRFSVLRPASSGLSGTRGQTCRRLYSSTLKPSRFSSTSAVCSNTTTFSPSRTRVRDGDGPSTVSAPLPISSTSKLERSAAASTGWQVTPKPVSNLAVWPGGSKSAIFEAGRGGTASGMTCSLKESSWLSPVLNLNLAVI